MDPSEADELVAAVAAAARRDRATVGAGGGLLPAAIEGVVVERLSPIVDGRGSLTPFLDVRRPFWSEPVVYAYEFTIMAGRIKGWGMHERQTDRYLVAGGRVRVALFDGRSESPTRGRVAELHFSERAPGVVQIPPGVWHADQNYGETEARLVNFPTVPYDAAEPDKQRIDPHAGVIPFDWAIRDG